MISQSSFIPFHHYDFDSINDVVDSEEIVLTEHGSSNTAGQHFIMVADTNKDICFSFVSVGKNDDGNIYLCVFNNQPPEVRRYQIIRTENNDFLIHVNHQYFHYSPNKEFIGKLPYHLYQLAKNTINNEQVIMAHSTVDALEMYQTNFSDSVAELS